MIRLHVIIDYCLYRCLHEKVTEVKDVKKTHGQVILIIDPHQSLTHNCPSSVMNN